MHVMHVWVRFLLIFAAAFALAQQPGLEPDHSGQKPLPTVSYDVVFPGAKPAHFAFTVESSGRAAYRSDELAPAGAPNEAATGDPYMVKFTVSPATASRIFDLTRQANYFKGNFDFTKHRVANTGNKTLTYSEGPAQFVGQPTKGVRSETTYNYSENPAIQQLTAIFEQMSNTLELGHRLDFMRRFDKLGIDAELKRAEEMAADQRLAELQAIAPVLTNIENDSSIMHVARNRAQHLLALAQPSNGAKSAQ